MSTCHHVWQPLADLTGITQRCVNCGEEKHVTTYEHQRLQTLAYIFRDTRQEEQVADAVSRMRAWAAEHPEADTQGPMDDEWEALAKAALSLDADSDSLDASA